MFKVLHCLFVKGSLLMYHICYDGYKCLSVNLTRPVSTSSKTTQLCFPMTVKDFTGCQNLMGRSGAVARGFLTTMPVAESHKKKKKLSTLTQEVNLHHFMVFKLFRSQFLIITYSQFFYNLLCFCICRWATSNTFCA